MRGGPGLGNIQPSQADYYQSPNPPDMEIFIPSSCTSQSYKKPIDMTVLAFDFGRKKYRTWFCGG